MEAQAELERFIEEIPKAELHVHIEGTLEPELYVQLAKKNGVKLASEDPEKIRARYDFTKLQDFLDLYHEATQALHTEEDFYKLTYAYFKKLKEQSVRHAEVFVDTQTHTNRGIPFEVVINGIHRALIDAEKSLDITGSLILCFLRHLSEEEALVTLEKAIEHKDKILGIGLASSEVGHPPSKFEKAFQKAREAGFRIVAHAGEEGPPSYIWEALDLLKAERIDHGNRSMEDPELLDRLVEMKMPLTMCPQSNLRLCVIDDLSEHPVKQMMEMGIMVTLNSDDPAYFGGHLNENYVWTAKATGMTKDHVIQLAQNSFRASFLSAEEKDKYLREIDEYVERFN